MNDDSTRVWSDGTDDYPLDPQQAADIEPCPYCQAQIPVGEQFCPQCGYQRGTWQEGAAAEPVADEPADVELSDARFALVSNEGRSYPLVDGESVVGRSGEADVTIADGYISRLHARFLVEDDSITITDLGSANGTFIGEDRLAADEPVELMVGTELKLGQTMLQLTRVESLAASGQTAVPDEDRIPGDLAEANLEIKPVGSPWSLKRTGTDEVLYLPYGETKLGRKPERCDLVVRGDSYISGLHCRVIASLEHLEIADMGSTNGTYVRGEHCAPDQIIELNAGDELRVGATDFTVAYEEPAEDAQIMANDLTMDDVAPGEPEAAGETTPDA
ncbi:FHA domain-containing protein [bacterium]|nr:FHA domain-containing protein [bacterium]